MTLSQIDARIVVARADQLRAWNAGQIDTAMRLGDAIDALLDHRSVVVRIDSSAAPVFA